MGDYDLGLVKGPLTERFDFLLEDCYNLSKVTTYPKQAGVIQFLRNIEDDLNKLKHHGDKELMDRYKVSLVPHLEKVHYSFLHFR
jgi:hypothetical protein|nr:MAG TPA: hypothetical protein [Caudoviricetes sp.]